MDQNIEQAIENAKIRKKQAMQYFEKKSKSRGCEEYTKHQNERVK